MSPIHNEEKSNRSASDFFELLLTEYICSEYGLTFSYVADLSEVIAKLESLSNGQQRIFLQNNNFLKIKPKVKEIIDSEITSKGDVIKVIWTGRDLTIKTTSDVDAKHTSEKLTRFSVKSISGDGLGTLKNVGMRGFKKLYGFDPKPDYEEMWIKLKRYLISQGINVNNKSKTDIKNICNANPKLLERANNNSRPYQRKFNELACNGFNALSNEKKKEYISYISDSNDPDLYVIIVNESQYEPIIYKPINEYQRKEDNVIEGRLNSDAEFLIYVDNMPLYRVSTNCTNGLGISAFCQRIFIIK